MGKLCKNTCCGPPPVDCRCCRDETFRRASVATRLLYLGCLAFVTIFACFFIINYGEMAGKGMSALWFCRNGSELLEFDGYWGSCIGHAGYFMVYRIFLALVVPVILIGILVICVHSSTDPCRPGVHQGFWLWKFLIFLALVFVFAFTVTVAGNAVFDESFMYFGLGATFLFSFPTLVFILDVCEIIVIKLKRSCSSRPFFFFVYSVLTLLVYLSGFGGLTILGFFYTERRTGMPGTLPFGSTEYCTHNIMLMVYALSVGVFVTVIAGIRAVIKHNRYRNTGFLQAGVVYTHTVFAIYLALGNHIDISCRPVYYATPYNPNALDVTFTPEGFVHAVFVMATLAYFTLGKGPITESAPLSRIFKCIFCMREPPAITDDDTLEAAGSPDMTATANKPQQLTSKELMEVPSVHSLQQPQIASRTEMLIPNSTTSIAPTPVQAGAAEVNVALEDPYEDEAQYVRYNWSLFHLFLIFGALSLMMGMTNFIRPRADGPNSSSIPAFWLKFLISPLGVIIFTIPIFVPVKLFPVKHKPNEVAPLVEPDVENPAIPAPEAEHTNETPVPAVTDLPEIVITPEETAPANATNPESNQVQKDEMATSHGKKKHRLNYWIGHRDKPHPETEVERKTS
ncbi:unnamed protein product [Allacma fusca]|uniref:Uncharacterized protein n=1 Tax=Allacma fusca TaxID=39272 RepID=A0A8J2Q100_9HEXA|nr:unnamed protein product [Allacma fusca]